MDIFERHRLLGALLNKKEHLLLELNRTDDKEKRKYILSELQPIYSEIEILNDFS
jgi:hypothetical protein